MYKCLPLIVVDKVTLRLDFKLKIQILTSVLVSFPKFRESSSDHNQISINTRSSYTGDQIVLIKNHLILSSTRKTRTSSGNKQQFKILLSIPKYQRSKIKLNITLTSTSSLTNKIALMLSRLCTIIVIVLHKIKLMLSLLNI